MGKANKITVGFDYYMDLLMGLGRGPVDELVEIEVGDRKLTMEPMTESGLRYINNPDLFGGTKGEGGIRGTLAFYPGEDDQTLLPGAQALLGDPAPGLLGVVSIYFSGLICSINPYPKKWRFRLRRNLAGWDGAPWYSARAKIILTGVDDEGNPGEIHAQNGVHILYEAITNRAWGRGIPRSIIDDAAFRAAADQTYAEGLGLCMRWSRQDTLGSFIQTVLDHINAALYLDKQTGLYTIKLIRSDYDSDELPVFNNDSGLLTITEANNAAPSGLINEILVNYTNPITNADGQVKAHNLASMQTQGVPNSDTRDYKGAPTPELALRLCERDLRVASTNLRRFTLVCDRRAWKIQPGMVLKIQDPQRGLGTVVVRVGSTEEQKQADGRITLVCIEDVFALNLNTFSQIQPPTWVPPDLDPQIARRLVYEMPYAECVQNFPPGEFAAIQPLTGYISAHAEKPTPVTMAFDLAVEAEGELQYDIRGNGDFCPLAEVNGTVEYLDDTVNFTATSDFFDIEANGLEAGTVIVIGSERLALDAVDLQAGTMTVRRGIHDTRPWRHLPGDLIWLVSYGDGSDWRPYMGGEHVDMKILPWTMQGGRFPIDQAPVDAIDFNFRFYRPYLPGNVRWSSLVQTETPWYEPKDLRDDVSSNEVPDYLTITWAHRDRVDQQDAAVAHEEASIGPEPGTTYRVTVKDAQGNTVRTESGITGTQYVYTYGAASSDLSVEASEDEPVVGYITLEAMRDGYVSWQNYTLQVNVYKQPVQQVDTASFSMMAVQPDDSYTDESGGAVSQSAMTTMQTTDADPIDGAYVANASSTSTQTATMIPKVYLYPVEMPYINLVQENRDLTHSQVMAMVGRPSDRVTDGYDFCDRLNGETSWANNGSGPWVPWGVLASSPEWLTDQVTLGTTSDADGVPLADVDLPCLGILDNEIVIVTAIDGKQVTLQRGAVDTIPARHYAGRSILWLYGDAHPSASRLYGDTDKVETVVRPHTYGAQVTPDQMPVSVREMKYRPRRPYPPGLLLANGQHFYETINGLADNFNPFAPEGKDVVFTWAHRDRVRQGATPYDHFASGLPKEEGVEYRIWIGYNTVGSGSQPVTLLEVYTTDNSWVLTKAMIEQYGVTVGRYFDSEAAVNMQVAVNAVRDGLYNWQGYGVTVLAPSFPATSDWDGDTGGGDTGSGGDTGGDDGDNGTGGTPGDGDPSDPVDPPINPDPDVPDTTPEPEPEPEPDPESQPGWGNAFDKGWAGPLPEEE